MEAQCCEAIIYIRALVNPPPYRFNELRLLTQLQLQYACRSYHTLQDFPNNLTVLKQVWTWEASKLTPDLSLMLLKASS